MPSKKTPAAKSSLSSKAKEQKLVESKLNAAVDKSKKKTTANQKTKTAPKTAVAATVKKTARAKTTPRQKSSSSKGSGSKSSGNKVSGSTGADKSAQSNHELVSKETAHTMMDRLCHLYPEADCELDFDSPFQLLTAVILSAQCTDVTVNKVTKVLFKEYPTAKDLAEADLDDVKQIIRATGYYNAKATNIQNCAAALVTKYGDKFPATLEELTELPGVGRKTANVVLGVEFGVPGWTVDTHVQRLSKRMGLTINEDPYKIELDLQNLFPKKDWSKLSITIIWHGRRMCYARKPDCPACPINDICPASVVK